MSRHEQTDPAPQDDTVLLARESMEELQQTLTSEIRRAVKEGMAEGFSDDAAKKFWLTGLEVLRSEASHQAGQFFLSAIWDLARRGFYIAVFLALVWAAGGIGLLKTVVLSLWSGGK